MNIVIVNGEEIEFEKEDCNTICLDPARRQLKGLMAYAKTCLFQNAVADYKITCSGVLEDEAFILRGCWPYQKDGAMYLIFDTSKFYNPSKEVSFEIVVKLTDGLPGYGFSAKI